MTARRDYNPPPTIHAVVERSGAATSQWRSWFGWVAKRLGSLYASATYDPGSVAAGAREGVNVTVTGARPGQYAVASFDALTSDVALMAAVTADDTVTVIFFNALGAGAVDLGSGTLRVRVGDVA